MKKSKKTCKKNESVKKNLDTLEGISLICVLNTQNTHDMSNKKTKTTFIK